MPASYPSSAKTFTTKSDGAGNTILAAHINDLQLEVTAVEQDLIGGLPIARGGTGLTSLTANRIPYGNGTSALQSSANLTFDGSTLTTAAISGTTGVFSGTLTPQGLVDASGASAGQIKFPASQNASADANTLDDYEEGVWTPAFGGSGGQSGQAYTIQVGRYVKIGKLVHCQFRVQLSALGTLTTSVQLSGLPFASENTTNLSASLVIGRWANFTSTVVWVGGDLGPNVQVVNLYCLPAASQSYANMVQADLANTSYLDGSITYRTA